MVSDTFFGLFIGFGFFCGLPFSLDFSLVLQNTARAAELTSFELPHDKINKMAFAPREDSDQSGHLLSPVSFRCLHVETLDPLLPTEHTDLIRLGRFCWFCHVVAHLEIDVAEEFLTLFS